mgnify:FL=1|jgi:hypothetical protein
MKEQRIRFTTALTACSCGAVPYDPDVRPKGQVGLTRYRKSKYGKDGGWSVVCTRCGCVGERGRTQIDAADRWDARQLKYGPLKEDKDK